MPDSRTEQILQAVLAALDGPGKPAAASVDRNRRQPVEAAELPRISVERLDESVAGAGNSRLSPLADRRLRIAVVSRVAGPDADLDPFSQWAVTALGSTDGAITDPALRALAVAIEEQAVDWEYDEDAHFDYSVEARMFEIRYGTLAGDLAAVE